MRRVLVTGSREWDDAFALIRVLNEEHHKSGGDMVVIHGDARRGADAIAKQWCKVTGIAMEIHPANWKLGKGAGYIRNQEMVDAGADVCHAFIKGESRGTKHCVKMARKANIPVVTHRAAA